MRPRLIVVEDDDADFRIIARTLHLVGFEPEGIQRVEDGDDALARVNALRAEAPLAPLVILLDLNLPRVDGLAVLERLQQGPGMQDVAVVVYTTSLDPSHEEQARARGAIEFLNKDCEPAELADALRTAISSLTGDDRLLSVLVVDDDELFVRTVQASLTKTQPKISVLTAFDLKSARSIIDSESVDCVLLDLKLPDGDGLSLLADDRDLPAIVVTGDDRDETVNRALAAGAEDFLVKDEATPRILGRIVRYAAQRKKLYAYRRVRVLAAGVADRIRNQVTGVLLFLEMAEKLVADPSPDDAAATREELPELLDDVRAGVEQVVVTAQELQDYANLRGGWPEWWEELES